MPIQLLESLNVPSDLTSDQCGAECQLYFQAFQKNGSIKKNMQELKAFANPPQQVIDIMKVFVLVLFSKNTDNWKKELANPMEIVNLV